jgi:outer membrane lipoprotein-sorting protein
VECGYCHVEGHFDKDDKKPKQTAREMMRMMLAIDKDSFEGNREVTCYSCHRGSPRPKGIPAIGSEMEPNHEMAQAVTPEAEQLPTNVPTADQLIDTYVRALGGADAIEKIATREATGTASSGGKSVGIEVYDRDPDQQALIRHRQAGDTSTVFDGHEGWSTIPGRPAREMQGAELDAAQMDADLHFALHIKQEFAELRVEYPEKIGNREAYVVLGTKQGQPSVKFYFDEQSGLLLRLLRYAESPLGRNPTQIDYGDYRETDGVEIPFRWTVAQPDESSTIQLEQVQQNVPISDSRFAKPGS